MYFISSTLFWTFVVLVSFPNIFVNALHIIRNEDVTNSPELAKRSSHFHSSEPDAPYHDPNLPPQLTRRTRELIDRDPEPRVIMPEEQLPSNLHTSLKRKSSSLVETSEDSFHTLQVRGVRKFPATSPNGPLKPKVGLGLTGDPTNKPAKLIDVNSQPAATIDECSGPLKYVSSIGGDKSIVKAGDLLPKTTILESRHVQQGNIGDCAFGAAIKALILSGYEGNIRKVFYIPDHPAWNNSQNVVGYFYKADLSKRTLIIDDRLPQVCSGGWLSFQPVDLVFLVPLLEKAMVKFVDEYPADYRFGGDVKVYGYPGIAGISGGKVIRTIIGGTWQEEFRANHDKRSTNQQGNSFLDRLRWCVTKANACVLGSPHFRNFDKDEVQTGINLNGFPTDRKPLKKDDPVWGGRRATLIAGWTIENIIQLGDDDRQGLFARVRNTAQKKDYIIVGAHAYAISKSSVAGEEMVMISNPWNVNPTITGDSDYANKGEYHMPLKVAAALFRRVEWVGKRDYS